MDPSVLPLSLLLAARKRDALKLSRRFSTHPLRVLINWETGPKASRGSGNVTRAPLGQSGSLARAAFEATRERAARSQTQSPQVANMPTAAAAMTAVASQPKIF